MINREVAGMLLDWKETITWKPSLTHSSSKRFRGPQALLFPARDRALDIAIESDKLSLSD